MQYIVKGQEGGKNILKYISCRYDNDKENFGQDGTIHTWTQV